MNFKMFECPTFNRESFALKMRTMAIAETIFDIALGAGLFQETDRRAVAYALRHEDVSTPLFVCKIGNSFPDERFRKNCFALAPEKLDRAHRHGHKTSHITRDGVAKWGGGFWITVGDTKWGIGISGEKEWEDEALGIIFALYTFAISGYTEEMYEIMEIGGSKVFSDNVLTVVHNKIGAPAV